VTVPFAKTEITFRDRVPSVRSPRPPPSVPGNRPGAFRWRVTDIAADGAGRSPPIGLRDAAGDVAAKPREGEWVYPVPPLAVPTEDSLDGEDSLRYGAVRLFVERARAAAPHLSPDARVAAVIAGICRRLDVPLTIELAASPAATLGIEELAARLYHRFDLLIKGPGCELAHTSLRLTPVCSMST